ncbi:MAG: YdiU family protein [Myxococcota bacterium]|nr:YdiU family protein [Myxococcota bacterium]
MDGGPLDSLVWGDSFVRALPGDPELRNERRQVRGACFSRVAPTPVASPKLIACVREVAELLDLPPAACASQELADVIGGNRVLPGMQPYAACYGGHQFGNWAGQLGDGRAITLGEVLNRRGERWEVQLKGAGPTPYSRRGDGRAVLRSSVRELLCSEAMHHLGVPTTRALGLVVTGDAVVRDMFYDGRAAPEPGAIVCRVAPSFLRFGSFEIFASRGEHEVLGAIARYAIETHFPELRAELAPEGPPSADLCVRWLEEIARRTAIMVVHWMRVGFVHGVMNTDNMSILGLTIDYGPYGWIDAYDPDWTPNTTDASGRRYRFGHQPRIALWNLARFAEALLPLVGAAEPLEEALAVYADTFAREHARMIAAKLGLRELREDDEPLVDDLYAMLGELETDMTIFFRRLADVPLDASAPDDALLAPLRDAYYAPDALTPERTERIAGWLRRHAARARDDDDARADERRARMNTTNPKYVLRNYLAQLAIDRAEQGDASTLEEILDVMRRPYDEQPGHEQYAEKRPEWARHRAGCSMLSCSS